MVGLFKKDLCDIPNPHLLKVREYLADFACNISWKEGKNHLIADAFSRISHDQVPLSSSNKEKGSSVFIRQAAGYKTLSTIRDHIDSDYNALIDALLSGLPPKQFPKLSAYHGVWNHMSVLYDPDDLDNDEALLVLDGTRIVVPTKARAELVELLHTSHQGERKTYQHASELYYWPGMKHQVLQAV